MLACKINRAPEFKAIDPFIWPPNNGNIISMCYRSSCQRRELFANPVQSIMCKDIFFKIQNSEIHQLFLGGFYLGNEIVHCQTIILQQAESGGDGSGLCDSASPLDQRIQQGGVQNLHNNKRDAEGRNDK